MHGKGGKGLRLMHFGVMSGGKEMIYDTKILHDGGSGGDSNDDADAGPSAATATFYDESKT